MKQRIIVITVTILICLAALPAILSYRVSKTFNLYQPAATHLYTFGRASWLDCEGNLQSWIRYDVQYIIEIMIGTLKEFEDPAHLERLLSDKNYLQTYESEYKDMLNTYISKQLSYEDDVPPYFCHAKVYEIHQAMNRMGNRNIFFYTALLLQDREKTTSRLQGIKDVISVIVGEIVTDTQLKPMYDVAKAQILNTP